MRSRGKCSNTPSKHQAGDLRLEAVHVDVVVLQIIARPTAAGGGIATADAVDMHADRQIRRSAPRRRWASNVCGPAARWSSMAAGSARSARSPARRAISSTARSGSSCATVTLARSRGSGFTQLLDLPLVHRGAKRGVEIGVARAAMQRRQDADGGIVRVKQLRLHECQVGTGRTTRRRPRVPPCGCGRGFRILRAGAERQPRLRAILRQMLAPPLRQPRMQFGSVPRGRMDVAVDDAGADRARGLARQDFAHASVSFKRG